VGNLVNQHVRFIETGEFLIYPKPVLGSSEGRLIERKQMSTKTTFKRVALVAVAALGLSLVAVAPSQAVPQVDTLTASALTATAVPGAAASVTLSHTYLSTGTGDTVTATVSIVSMPAGNTALPVLASVTTNDTGSPTKVVSGLTASTGSVAASTAVRGDYTLSLTTLTTGTYVFTVTPQSGSKASALTLTYTIADTAVAPTATSSRVYMRSAALNGQGSSVALLLDGGGYEQVATYNSSTSSNTYTQATLKTNLGTQIATQDASASNVTALTVTGGSTTFGNTVASFGLILGNGDTITASTISGAVQNIGDGAGNAAGGFTLYAPQPGYYFNAPGFPVTVTVTGPGTITYEGAAKGKTFTEANTNANYLQKSYSLLSDGTLGTSTITFTAGGVTLATRTVNFVGPLASLSVARAATFGGSSFPVATNTGAYVVTAKDANGLALPSTVVYAFSGTTATATIAASVTTGATGTATFDLVGVAAGTTAITFGNASTAATSTITATAAAEVTGSTATTVTLTLDKAEYAPGEKMTLTVSAKDANGKPVADGSRALIASPTSNVALGCTVSTTTTLLAGSATQTCYAPATTGSFTISVTEGAATASTTKATLTVTALVVNSAETVAQAAVDAAAEAIDAANAATDAANAAAEAADAATAAAQDAADAVAALSVSVAAMIDSLKKQITALTNLVIKIQKKVKA